MQAHLVRLGEAIQRVESYPKLTGCFKLNWAVPRPIRVSVIIPTRDRPNLLGQCLANVWCTTTEVRAHGVVMELIVVDDGSVKAETATLLKTLQTNIGEGFQVLRVDDPFNWSKLNNLAAKQANG